MKRVDYYKTLDGQQFTSETQAESHALSHAHKELKSLLDTTCPYLDNTYAIAQRIILHKDSIKSLNKIVRWLDDASTHEEN